MIVSVDVGLSVVFSERKQVACRTSEGAPTTIPMSLADRRDTDSRIVSQNIAIRKNTPDRSFSQSSFSDSTPHRTITRPETICTPSARTSRNR